MCPEVRLRKSIGVCWEGLGLQTPTEDRPNEEEVTGSRRHFLHLLCPPRAQAAFPCSCGLQPPVGWQGEVRKGPDGEAQEERESSQGSNMCRAGETGKQNLILPLDGGTSPQKPGGICCA